MKAGIFIAAMVQLAAAQPHRHMHAEHHQLQKKDDVTVLDVTYVTATGPNVVVYVDANGNPVSTSIEGQAAPTPVAAPVAAPAPVAVEPAATSVAPVVAAAPAATSVVVAAAPAKKHKSKTPATTSSASTSINTDSAIAYSPYNADGPCKTQDQVNADLDGLAGFGMFRIYGTDCDQVNTVGSYAKAHGQKIFAGIFDINNVASEAQTIIDAAAGDFSYIDTVSVGNELVNSGQATPDQVIAALNQARGILNGAGYTGKMVTVDTFIALIDNPSLCEASDFAAANAHAFFDPNTLPAAAGAWAYATMLSVKAACGGKDTMITESGMPSAGSCNGLMCPSPANQQAAISSLKSAFPDGGLILFTAYNDLWKTNTAETFWAEQSYGIYGNSPS